MDTASLNLSFVRGRSVRHQIEEQMREMILSGKLAPGSKLPSTHELAHSWGTHSPTVHAALKPLVHEGLISRSHRVGTFVCEREEKLTCVGVYAQKPASIAPFSCALREALKEELHQDGIQLDVWVDSRPGDQLHEPWKPLVRAAEDRRFQAFIGVETNLPLLKWQQKLPIPTAFVGVPASIPNSVTMDMRQLVDLGLHELARQGCRSVGLISPLVPTLIPSRPLESLDATYDILEHFTDSASELGLIVKNEWMEVQDTHYGSWTQEQLGYEQFLKLWNHAEKPEGLLVFPDCVARGVVMAIREKHVRVPEELKLVLHKNESIDLFCPMPATFVVTSEREIARTLIEQVQKQFRGESCERISLPFKIVAHNNP